MPADSECFTCVTNSQAVLPPRDNVYSSAYWRAAHAFGTALPGWLVLVPLRHVLALDELTPEESAELGPLLRGLTAAMRKALHCEKTYVAQFSEAGGFEHLHFHVIPRSPGLAADFTGPYIFRLLGGDPQQHVPESTRDQVAASIASALSILCRCIAAMNLQGFKYIKISG